MVGLSFYDPEEIEGEYNILLDDGLIEDREYFMMYLKGGE